jgi:exosortase/archaeosortase family protein
MFAGAALVVIHQAAFRDFEAWSVGGVAGHLLGVREVTNSGQPIIFTTLPSHGALTWVGVLVTAECTAVWLIGPFLLLAGLLAQGRQLKVRAVVVATVVTAAALLVVNIVRLSVIVDATHLWGVNNGFKWSHEVYGSLITIVGVCLSLVLYFRLLIVLSRRATEPAALGESA